MNTQFIERIAKLSRMAVSELSNMPYNKIVHDVILERILRPGGQYIRGWRIGDDYMGLMADFGDICYQEDPYTGEIMLEIALQRLSNGAVLHESSRYDILPPDYIKYWAAYDQHGLMSDEGWRFLTKQYKSCLSANLTKAHITKIIFGLIDHLTEDGKELDDYMFAHDHLKTTNKEGFDWAWKTAKDELSFEQRFHHFATPQRWARFKAFFKENWKEIDNDDFFYQIGESGFWNKRKIRKEILK